MLIQEMDDSTLALRQGVGWAPPLPQPAKRSQIAAEAAVRGKKKLRLSMGRPPVRHLTRGLPLRQGEEFGGGGEYREITPPTRLVFTWTWDRPDAGDGTQLVEVDFSEQPDGTTKVVMTNRGLLDEAIRESHREGWEGSFDNLDRVLAH